MLKFGFYFESKFQNKYLQNDHLFLVICSFNIVSSTTIKIPTNLKFKTRSSLLFIGFSLLFILLLVIWMIKSYANHLMLSNEKRSKLMSNIGVLCAIALMIGSF